MICPYQNCRGDVTVDTILGYCLSCSQPLFVCPGPGCHTANRTFAKYCRNCGRDVNFASASFEQSKRRKGFDFTKDSRTIFIDDSFWVAPVAYKGFLWCLSEKGNLWRVSPYSKEPFHFGFMDDTGFGKAPFQICEITTAARPTERIPYLFAISSRSIKGINLVTGEPTQFAHLEQNGQILSSLEEGWVALVADDSCLYFLMKKADRISLIILHVASGKLTDVLLAGVQVAGPFRSGRRIGAYSHDSLYLFENDRLHVHPLPASFKPRIDAEEVRDLQSPFGRACYLAAEEWLYIPGMIGENPGFLFVSLKGESPSFIQLPIRGEATYSQDKIGRLIVARQGEIAIYEGASLLGHKADPDLQAYGLPYYDEPMTIGRARTSGGFECLRFFENDKIENYPIANLNNFLEFGGFYSVGGALVLAYLTAQGQLRMVAWDS